MITNITIFVALMQFGSMMQIASVTSIDGQVRDAQTHKALAMVRIELLHQGIPNATILTDSDGKFRFPNVAAGSYTLYAASTEYEHRSIDVDSMMDWRIDVELKRKKDRVETGPAVVSVQEIKREATPKSGRLRRLLMKLK